MSPDSKNKKPIGAVIGRGMLPPELRHASGMKRLNYIHDLADPAAFIKGLQTQELYLLIRDIGKNDAYILLEHANQEQLSGIMDIEVWHKDRMDVSRWLDWFELARECNFETVLRYIDATQSDLLQLIFTREVKVHGKDLDTDTVPDELELHSSPDFMFYFTLPREHEMADRLPALLKLLWASNPDRMRIICDTARFDLPSALEESLFRFRNGRLEDMGFGNPEEAHELFEIVNPKSLRNQARKILDELPELDLRIEGHFAQDMILRDIAAPDLLSQAISNLDEKARLQFGEAFGYLVNRVFLARTQDLSMTDELPEAGSHAAALVNLGLGYVADESTEVATQVLRHIWPLQLFRVGHSLTITQALRARRLRLRCGAVRGLSLFGQQIEDLLAAVALPYPMLEGSILRKGEVGRIWITTTAELSLAEVHLDRADSVLTFFEEQLGFSPDALMNVTLQGVSPEVVHRIRFATLLRTGLAQLALTDEFGFAPLERSDLVAFLALSVENDSISSTMETLVSKLKEHTPPAVSDFIDDALEELVLALGRVHTSDITPEYASELFIVRL